MAKVTKAGSLYNKAVENRILIMAVLLLVLVPTLILIGYMTFTYTTNKPNPFSEIEYTKTTEKKINSNLFEFDMELTKWIVEDVVTEEYKSNASVTFKYTIGDKIDTSITSISVKTYICYNWANYTSSAAQYTSLVFNNSNQASTTFNAALDKKPFFWVNINVNNDVIFYTALTCKFTDDNNEPYEEVYVLTHSYKDLYVSGSTLLA